MKVFSRLSQATIYHPEVVLSMNARFRRSSTLFLFIIFVLAVSVISLLAYSTFHHYFELYSGSERNHGSEYFQIVIFTLTIVCSLLGISLGSGVVNGEKARKTFEFLVTSSVTPEYIVVGKFFAHFFHILLFVLACAPFMMMALYLGGLDTSLALLSLYTLLLLASANLAISMAFSAMTPILGSSMVLSFLTCGGLTTMLMTEAGNLMSPYGRLHVNNLAFLEFAVMFTLLWMVVTGLSFVSCSVALKNRFANRTIGFKIWILFTCTVFFFIGWYLYFIKKGTIGTLPYIAFVILFGFFSYMCVESSIFHPKSEERWTKLWYALRPGGTRNFIFMLIVGAMYLVSFATLLTSASSPYPVYYRYFDTIERLLFLSCYLISWLMFICSVGIFIGSHTGFFKKPFIIHTVALLIICLIYPLIRLYITSFTRSPLSESDIDIYISPFFVLEATNWFNTNRLDKSGLAILMLVILSVIMLIKSHRKVEYLKSLVRSTGKPALTIK
ncbi:MAG: hypothetical protein HY606_15420 [Planctomycetes bacterium]|nr:hypothetical protein [Planctomycetota bacterium]